MSNETKEQTCGGGVGVAWGDVPAGDLSVRSGKIFFLGKTDTD